MLNNSNSIWFNPAATVASTLPLTTVSTTKSDGQVSTTTVNKIEVAWPPRAVQFIRAREVKFNATNVKPNTRMWAFFDGVPVDNFCRLASSTELGTQLITDASGDISGVFQIPPQTFNTGTRIFYLQDHPNFSLNQYLGSIIGSASATYTASGLRHTYQETQNTAVTLTLNIIDPPPPVVINRNIFVLVLSNAALERQGRLDPTAQTFFTNGVTGGCFITSIDLYFFDKDDTIPMQIEIREVVNGYPGENLASKFSLARLSPANINVSPDASIATNCKFPIPIYLKEDTDYCFVLISNSNKYSIFTSKMGERSLEPPNKTIFEQPYLGSLFKSENNRTWTAEQYEDVKFTLYKAKFDTGAIGTLDYSTRSTPYLLMGSKFNVTAGSSIVSVACDNQHGMINGDTVGIVSQRNMGPGIPDAVYRGIPAASINGNYPVTVLSDYMFQFNAGAAATTTGTLACPGYVFSIEVDRGGNGYTQGTTTVTISAPPSGVTATASVTVTNGAITAVTITNPGSGYTIPPTFTLSGGSGVNAVLTLICESIFVVTTNNIAHSLNPQFVNVVPNGTELDTTVKFTDTAYSMSAPGKAILHSEYATGKPAIIPSSLNETLRLPGAKPTQTVLTMKTSNPDLSPVIVTSETPKMLAHGYLINNQSVIETISSTSAAGSVDSMVVSVPGDGYTTATCIISPPNISAVEGGIQATATVTCAGGVVTGFTITNPGYGYLRIPTVVITGPGIHNTVALGNVVLTDFNSELLPVGGSAMSRYITKSFTLAEISKGARVNVTAASTSATSFEVYIRTSLSSVGIIHENQEWTQLTCDVARNRSRSPAEFLDYTFNIDNLEPFDIYSIKIVLRSTDRSIVPVISNYSCIILAT